MSSPIKITPPLTDEVIIKLKAGDRVLITGVIYTGRDMAHKYMVEGHKKGQAFPFDLKGQVLYYTGPTPAPPGRPIGAAGPTTSYRMDKYAPYLLEHGLKAMIGKGPRGEEVKGSIKKNTGRLFRSHRRGRSPHLQGHQKGGGHRLSRARHRGGACGSRSRTSRSSW